MTGVIEGRLELVCGLDSTGKSALRRQFCEPPFHVGKGYLTGDLLAVQVANPSAGVFSGDRLSVDVQVDAGARLHVKTPAATSLFPGRGTARIEQNLKVSAGAYLEWTPEPLIPHAGSKLEQSLTIEVERGGELYSAEVITPGRVARGEVLQYERLEFRTRILIDGNCVARERLLLTPPESNWLLRRNGWEGAFVANIWIVTAEEFPEKPGILRKLEELQTDAFLIGATRLDARLIAVRAVARDSVAMRGGLAAVKAALA